MHICTHLVSSLYFSLAKVESFSLVKKPVGVLLVCVSPFIAIFLVIVDPLFVAVVYLFTGNDVRELLTFRWHS